MTNEKAKTILDAIQKCREIQTELDDWLINTCHLLNPRDSAQQFDSFEKDIAKFAHEAAKEFCLATGQVGKEMFLSYYDLHWIKENTIKLNKEYNNHD